MRYFFDLTYNGKPFHGWQKQSNALGIQEVVENTLATATRRERQVIAAGRTDTGVHAEHMIAHADFDEKINEKHLRYKLNRMLPKSIAVNEIFEVKENAHARFDAVSRAYYYQISPSKNPFLNPFSALIKQDLNVEKMQRGAEIIQEYRDFKCFSKSRTDVKTYFCAIKEARWTNRGNLLVFEIKADRFLRNMVRAIVGTLLELGTGKKEEDDLRQVLESRDRQMAGKSMEARGLFLKKVSYPNWIIK